MVSRRTVPSWVTAKARSAKSQSAGLKHGFRSGLEEKIAKDIESHGYPVLFETFAIPYVVPETRRKYTPDFHLMHNGIIVESKGIFDAVDRAKHLFIKAQYPELDIRFVFTRSSAPINKGSKTTLADWCVKNGYRYADKLIPEAWYAEQGPKEDPMDIIGRGPFGYLNKEKTS